MKRTKRILSALALFLLAAMLFTSCGVNYAKDDMSKYISLDASGYNGLKSEIEKQVYAKEVVMKKVYESLRTKKDGQPDGGTTSGIVEKYDEVTFYTWAVDADGNVALSNIVRDEEGNIAPETIGVGYGTNKDMLLELEKMFYGEGKEVDIKDHLFKYENNKTTSIPAEAFWFITYTSVTKPDEGQGVVGGSQSKEYVLNSSIYLNKETQGNGDYYEAISLGLKKLADHFASTEDKTDGVKGGDTVYSIYVYPTNSDATLGETQADSVHIKYDIDLNKDETFDKGVITLTVKAAAFLDQGDAGTDSEGFKATALKMSYTFPSDYKGQYTVKGSDTKKDLAGVEVDVYIYPTFKVSYEMPDYDAVTDEEKTALSDAIKAKMPSDITDIDELKKAYEEHVRTEIEKEFVEKAEADAKAKIWESVVANTKFVKTPTANIKALVRDAKRTLKYNYTSNSYEIVKDEKTGKSTVVTAYQSGKYKNYLEWAAKQDETANGDVTKYENSLWAEAEYTVKQMMLTYYLADALGITVSDEEYNAKLATASKAWIDEMVEYYATYYKVNLTLTADDYVEAVGGEDMVRSACLLEKVKDKLYEMNKAGVTYTEKELNAFVEPEKTEEEDHEGHDHD